MEGGFGLCLVMIYISMSMKIVAGVNSPPAIFVFGDSILDVGNNNYIPGASDDDRANHPMYGIDFPSRIPPTGRFSNGYNTADYVAMSMGFVAGSPPPYLSLLQQDSSDGDLVAVTALSRGISYASGGAGILNSTSAGSSIPLLQQVQYFKDTRARMIATDDADAVNDLISRSVLLISVGSNDLFAFFAEHNNDQQQQTETDAAALYDRLISIYSDAIKELYTLDVRRFAIMNTLLIGCHPASRLLSPTGACSDVLNQLAGGFNEELSSLMPSLAKQLPGLIYSLADTYGFMAAAFFSNDPQKNLGFTNVASACCGRGRLNAEAECTPTSVLCRNRDQLFFFDRLHPSQRAAFLIAKAFYDDPAHHYTTPINFMRLAHRTTTT